MNLYTRDVDQACEDLAAAGFPVRQRPHNAGNNNRNALLRDPDGNLGEIVAMTSSRSLSSCAAQTLVLFITAVLVAILLVAPQPSAAHRRRQRQPYARSGLAG